MNKIKIIALFGEAGSGKDFLFNKVIHWDEESLSPPIFNKIIKTTTRPKREKERYGIDYHFLDNNPSIFELAAQKGILTAISEYRDWKYGIDIRQLKEDKSNLVILDLQAIKNLIKDGRYDLTLFKIIASPKTRMLRQLNREQNPDVDEINRRYEADKKEYATIDFNYIELQNETLEDSDSAMLEIMRAGSKVLLDKNI